MPSRPISRTPSGYRGVRHETLGSDLLSVQRSLGAIASNPAQVSRLLGEPSSSRLAQVQDDGWYPIDWLLEMMDIIDERIGPFGLLKLGRVLFNQSHAAIVQEHMKSGRDVVHGVNAMYHHANRGEEIGGWEVLSFEDNQARLRKTTPHHCMMEEGIVAEALKCVGSPALISQSECLRRGANACTFVIDPHVGAHWQSS